MTDRLARLLADLAAQGVTFAVRGGQIRIHGLERDGWLDDWLERNHSDLLLLLGCPRRPQATRTPIPLPEDARPTYNVLSVGPDRPRPAAGSSRAELVERLRSFALD